MEPLSPQQPQHEHTWDKATLCCTECGVSIRDELERLRPTPEWLEEFRQSSDRLNAALDSCLASVRACLRSVEALRDEMRRGGRNEQH